MKYEIEIPDLPDGWEAVAYRSAEIGEMYYDDGKLWTCDSKNFYEHLIIQKTTARRIVLEETDKTSDPDWIYSIRSNDITINIQSEKIWKIVDEKESNQNV
jgi:hypothetical protein